MDTELRKKLYSKMQSELDQFKENLRGETFENFVNKAYELTIKEEILVMFHIDNNYNIEDISALYKLKYPLEELYQSWMKYDGGIHNILELCIEDYLEDLQQREKMDSRELGR